MKLRTLLLLVSLCPAASAQTARQFSSGTTLQPGAAVEREMGPGQVHHFNVNLQENQFIQLVVDQSEIDVIVKVLSPSGKSLGEFDLSNGDDGPEHVSFVALATGKYSVTVGPLEQQDATVGRYQIKVVEVRKATDQELKTHKSVEVTKAKGVALLAEIEAIIPQIKSDQTRMKVQLQAAQLLWDIDEKTRSLKLITEATASFQAYVESIHPDHLQQFTHTISQLRHELIHTLVVRDPEAALSLLHSTSQMVAAAFEERDHFNRESALELAIADQIGRKNPKRAFEMARQVLKQGYSTSLINTLSELRQKDPELGAELAKEIAAKVLNENLLKRSEAGYVAAGLLRSVPASELSHQSTNGTAHPPLLSEAGVRELVQKAFDEALSYSPASRGSYEQGRDVAWNLLTALTAVATRLDTITPGGSAAVNKKLQEIGAGGNYDGSTNSTELSLESIGKMPVEQREQQYIQLAYNEGSNGQFTVARQIVNERVTNRYQRRQTLSQIDRQEMYQALNHGKANDVMRLLSGFTNSQERAQQLSQIATQIGPGLKRATALRVLEQARNMLSSSAHAEGQDQMHALLELARAFSRYDVKRSFEIVDPLIEQFNELVEAASKLNGFGFHYLDGEELDLQNSNPVAIVSSQISSVLGNLALVNFERAKATTDRITTPGVRLRVYLDIAQQTINAAK